MKSLDTNVLARFFIDDPDDTEASQQRPASISALSQPSIVTLTVMLEFEWVMRGFYGLTRGDIARVISTLLSIDHVIVEDHEAVSAALNLFKGGMDFADALHLARSTRANAFVTFDRRLARRAKELMALPDVELLN